MPPNIPGTVTADTLRRAPGDQLWKTHDAKVRAPHFLSQYGRGLHGARAMRACGPSRLWLRACLPASLQAQKEGPHHTVYWTTGERYQGEWFDNKRQGGCPMLQAPLARGRRDAGSSSGSRNSSSSGSCSGSRGSCRGTSTTTHDVPRMHILQAKAL